MTLVESLVASPGLFCSCRTELTFAENMWDEIEARGEDLLISILKSHGPAVCEDSLEYMRERERALLIYKKAVERVKCCSGCGDSSTSPPSS